LCHSESANDVPASAGSVLGGTLLLVALLLPLGVCSLRAAEWCLRSRFSLSVLERLLLGFYAAGFVLFVLATIPFPWYGRELFDGCLVVGVAGYVSLTIRERFLGLRAAFAYARTPVAMLVGFGTLGLFVLELLPVWNHPFPNTWDGSATALWTQLTLHNGTLPTNLQPFASAPVVYPLGTTVWMTFPVMFLGWSVVQTPVLLPPLFLSLTVPAAFAWGSRWYDGSSRVAGVVGLLFAGSFGLIVNWPRFYTGGSYDFAFALPLFMILLGFVPGLIRGKQSNIGALIGFGLASAVCASLSLAAGEGIIVTLAAFAAVEGGTDFRRFASILARVIVVAAFEVLALLRSLGEWVAQGEPAFAPSNAYGSMNSRLVQGELDPFVLWKPKLSPFPWVSLELQIMLVAGVVTAIWLMRRARGDAPYAPLTRFSRDLFIGTAGLFLFTALLLTSVAPWPAASLLRGVTNLDQASILLFLFFGGMSVLPLVAIAVWWSGSRTSTQIVAQTSRGGRDIGIRPTVHRSLRSALGSKVGGGLALSILILPLVLGAGYTVADGPGVIQQNVEKTSNVTPADVVAMQWIAGNLPRCSAVLVAPGSAGQFLPEFAVVRIIFPMNPVPVNNSYRVVVSDLIGGRYTAATRDALLSLGVTEILVTGQSSVSYAPFSASPLEASPDFGRTFAQGDASVFSFGAGVNASQCYP
jgi:hypothetical protein